MLSRFRSVLILSFTGGLHSGFIRFAFGMWLKECGMHIIYLGLMNLIFLPFSLKLFWMPFLESKFKPLARFGHRKSWIIFTEICIVLGILMLSLVNARTVSMSFILTYAFILCILIATKESLSIAYQMETIKAENWGSSEGKIAAGYHIGFWVGGIFLYASSAWIDWHILFVMVGIFLSILLFVNLLMPDSNFQTRAVGSFKERFLDQYKELVVRNRKIIIPLIAFIALYRLQDRIIMATSNYFFVDLEFSKMQMLLGKTVGIVMTIIGGLLGSYSVKKIGYKKTMILGMILHVFGASLFVIQSIMPKSYQLFYSIMLFEKVTRGFEGTVFFTYQMIFCSKYFITTQLSMLLGLDKLTGSIISSFSGVVINAIGWTWFFVFSFIGTIPSLLLLRKLPNTVKQEDEIAKESEKLA